MYRIDAARPSPSLIADHLSVTSLSKGYAAACPDRLFVDSGYAVPAFPESGLLCGGTPSVPLVQAWVEMLNLKDPGHAYALWTDPDSGKVYLEACIYCATEDEARIAAAKSELGHYYNLQTGEVRGVPMFYARHTTEDVRKAA